MWRTSKRKPFSEASISPFGPAERSEKALKNGRSSGGHRGQRAGRRAAWCAAWNRGRPGGTSYDPRRRSCHMQEISISRNVDNSARSPGGRDGRSFSTIAVMSGFRRMPADARARAADRRPHFLCARSERAHKRAPAATLCALRADTRSAARRHHNLTEWAGVQHAYARQQRWRTAARTGARELTLRRGGQTASALRSAPTMPPRNRTGIGPVPRRAIAFHEDDRHRVHAAQPPIVARI